MKLICRFNHTTKTSYRKKEMKGVIRILAGFILTASIILSGVINANAEEYELAMPGVDADGRASDELAIVHMESDGESSEMVIDRPETIIRTNDSVGINSDLNHVVLNIYVDGSAIDKLEKWETNVDSWVNENYGSLMYNQLSYGGTTEAPADGETPARNYNNYNLYLIKMRGLDGPSEGNNNTNNNSNESQSHNDESNNSQPVEAVEPVAQVAKAASSDLLAVVPAYSVGITTTSDGTTVGPVNAAVVNYANLAAKLLVSPTASVYKSLVVNGNSKNVTLSVDGLANGQKVTVLAFDIATGTWKKISATVKNGNVTFDKGNSNIFSIVVDMMAR